MNLLPVRKHPRLKAYDYAQQNAYFLTICSKGFAQILSKVCYDPESKVPVVHLLEYGKIAEKYITGISKHYPAVSVDNYVIMPNHIHLLITIGADCSTTVSTLIKTLKSLTTKEIGKSIWQTSFYDTVIDNDRVYEQVWMYIEDNPAKWLINKGKDY